MKKNNFKNKILALSLGLVFGVVSMPTILIPLNKATTIAEALSSAYVTKNIVDIDGEFDNTTSISNNWKFYANYNNGLDKDSTSYHDIVSTDLNNWSKNYSDRVDAFVEYWKSEHKTEISDSTIKQNVANAIISDISTENSPLFHDFELGVKQDGYVLALSSGKTYTKYLNDLDNTTVELASTNRLGYSRYISKEFTFNPYSFYRITTWVKVTNGATATIGLSGDKEEQVFNDIKNTGTVNNKTYYIYSFSNGVSETDTVISLSQPQTGSTIIYNNLEYSYDSTSETFVPNPLDPNYEDSMSNYHLSYVSEEIASYSDWAQYTIYVSTTSKTNLNLVLGLGGPNIASSGTVYFDDINIQEVEMNEFIKTDKTSTIKKYDYREILPSNNGITTSKNYTILQNFESSNDWTIIPSETGLDGLEPSIIEEDTISEYDDTFYASTKNHVLSIENYDTHTIQLKSPTFDIKQFRYYRLSVWVLSEDPDAKLVIELNGSMNNKTITTKNETSPYNSDERDKTTPSSLTNYWVEYSFYIKGSALYDTTAYLTMQISPSTTVCIDNFVIEYITEDDYLNQNEHMLDLSTSALTSKITNGYFTDYDNIDYSGYSYLLPPANWSSTKTETIYAQYDENGLLKQSYFKSDLAFDDGETTITLLSKNYTRDLTNSNFYNYYQDSKVFYQIRKIDDVVFTYDASRNSYYNSAYKIGISSNVSAGIVSGYNNLTLNPKGYFENYLKISSTSNESFNYKSAEIKFSTTSSLYKLSIDVLTDTTATANLKLTNKDGVVYAEFSNISTSNNWKTYTFYIATGFENIDLFLNISLEESTGDIYFKNISYTTTTTLTSLETENAKNTSDLLASRIAIIDLSKDTFIEHSTSLNSANLFDANLYKNVEIEGKQSGIFGILDTTAPDPNYSSIVAKDSEKSPYVLVIQNQANQSTKLTSLKTFSLAKGSNYKIVITAKANGFDENKYASIIFNNFNKQFNIANSDDYQTYTFYIEADEADEKTTINYSIEMLDCSGTLVIDNITVETIKDLESIKKDYPDGDSQTVMFETILSASKTDDAKDAKSDDSKPLEIEKESNTLEILFAVLSSLILVVAIIYAVIFLRVKTTAKVRTPKRKNKVSTSNDERGFV